MLKMKDIVIIRPELSEITAVYQHKMANMHEIA